MPDAILILFGLGFGFLLGLAWAYDRAYRAGKRDGLTFFLGLSNDHSK